MPVLTPAEALELARLLAAIGRPVTPAEEAGQLYWLGRLLALAATPRTIPPNPGRVVIRP